MAFDALYIILPVAAAIFGAGGGVFVKNIYDKNSAESKVAKADEMVKKMITDAQKRAETLKKETILEAKEEVYRLKTENERESKERRSELQRAERRLQQKEESFDKKQDALEQREQQLAKRIKAIDAKEASVSKLYDAQQQELERVAGMTQDEAAKSVGRSRPAITNSLRLLSLSEGVLELVEKGSLSAGHARALVPIAGEKKE